MSNSITDLENDRLDGFLELLNFHIVTWTDENAVLEIPISARHLNRNKAVHGGVLMSGMDTACGLSGTYCSVPGHIRRCVTISMNTQFMNPVGSGKLHVVGHMVSRTRKMFFAEARVFSGDSLVAVAQGTFRYILGGDQAEGIPRD